MNHDYEIHEISSGNSTPNLMTRLSFNECHIVIENIVRTRDKAFFLKRLQLLSANTKDPCLVKDLETLYEKIAVLSDDEFQTLRRDAEQNQILFPPNYALPNGF